MLNEALRRIVDHSEVDKRDRRGVRKYGTQQYKSQASQQHQIQTILPHLRHLEHPGAKLELHIENACERQSDLGADPCMV
jgi:hypothetical protein